MSEQLDPILHSAERLCETLERIGDALVAIDTETLLDTEETLDRLLRALRTDQEVSDPAALERLLRRAGEALARCRRLGSSFASIAGARVRLRTGVEVYGRDGTYVEPVVAGSAVKVMT